MTKGGDINLKDVQTVLNSIDTDGSGTINYTGKQHILFIDSPVKFLIPIFFIFYKEFLAATMEKSLYMKEEKLFNAFRMFDQDGSGKISAAELKQVLGSIKKIRINF